MAYKDIFYLSQNAEFLGRIQIAIAKQAIDIQNESGATQYHAERVTWANKALNDVPTMAKKMIWAIMYDNTILTNGINSTDAEIQTRVTTLVNQFALNP